MGFILPSFSAYQAPLPLFLPSLGFGELAILFIIILILFGPGKLPDVCRALGDGLKQFKQATRDDEPKNNKLPPPPPDA
jgi:sec-independent protein translocase protein TatA